MIAFLLFSQDTLIVISFLLLQDNEISKLAENLTHAVLLRLWGPAVEKPGPPHLTWKISQNIEPHTIKHLTNMARDCFSSQAGDIVRDCKGCPVSFSLKSQSIKLARIFISVTKKNTHQLYGSRLKKWSFYGQADRNISWPFRLCYTAIRTEQSTMRLSVALRIWNIWKCKGLVFAQFWSNIHQSSSNWS